MHLHLKVFNADVRTPLFLDVRLRSCSFVEPEKATDPRHRNLAAADYGAMGLSTFAEFGGAHSQLNYLESLAPFWINPDDGNNQRVPSLVWIHGAHEEDLNEHHW